MLKVLKVKLSPRTHEGKRGKWSASHPSSRGMQQSTWTEYETHTPLLAFMTYNSGF